MNSTDPLHDHAAQLIDAARAAEETLQLLSGSWYQLAADAVPGIAQRVDGLSHEEQVRLRATFQDVAAALARCARVCREARVVIARAIPDADLGPERDVQGSAGRVPA